MKGAIILGIVCMWLFIAIFTMIGYLLERWPNTTGPILLALIVTGTGAFFGFLVGLSRC